MRQKERWDPSTWREWLWERDTWHDSMPHGEGHGQLMEQLNSNSWGHKDPGHAGVSHWLSPTEVRTKKQTEKFPNGQLTRTQNRNEGWTMNLEGQTQGTQHYQKWHILQNVKNENVWFKNITHIYMYICVCVSLG